MYDLGFTYMGGRGWIVGWYACGHLVYARGAIAIGEACLWWMGLLGARFCEEGAS